MNKAEIQQRIGAAFDGIENENASGRTEALDDGAIRCAVREQRHLPVTLGTLTALADRINELSTIVAQNALVAGDAPQAGWGVPERECCECGRKVPALSAGGRCFDCEFADENPEEAGGQDYICGICGEPVAPIEGTCADCRASEIAHPEDVAAEGF